MAHVTPESPENAETAVERAAADAARRRAAAYLDLWESQLVHLAAEGAAPPRPRGRGRR